MTLQQQVETRAAASSVHYHALLDPLWIALIISCLFLLLLAVSCGWLRLKGSPLIVQLGAMTYPLYLMHQNIGFMPMNHLYRHLEKHLLLLLAIILMLALAYAVHHWIERPYAFKLKTYLRRILLLDKSWLSSRQGTSGGLTVNFFRISSIQPAAHGFGRHRLGEVIALGIVAA